MHYLLTYDVAPDYLTRRAEFREEHLTLAWKSADAGHLLAGGALEDPTDRAVLLFSGPTPDAAIAFAEADPYVRNGLIVRWRVQRWNTVVGELAASPLRPTDA